MDWRIYFETAPQLLNSSDPQILLSVFGERRRCFPNGDARDRETLLARVLEDQAREALGGGIAVEQIDGLAELLQRLHERVVVPQEHLVVKLPVNPSFHDPLDVTEVAHHVAAVELVGADLNLSDGVVAVRMLADAVVIEQPVAVAKF